MSRIKAALQDAVASVIPKTWKQAKKRADREDRLRPSDLDRFRYRRPPEIKLKDAAYAVMGEAYLKASADGTLPANARQIMYAARPLVLERTKGKCWSTSAYFTQVLLPGFVEKHPDLTADWDVVYDARGHIAEPHTDERIDLGTLAVRGYIGSWEEEPQDEVIRLEHRFPTAGPVNRYRHVLFVEKEGFNPLFDEVQLAERFDIAIMSTKGMSVTAARQLVEALSEQGATIFVLHDFDKAGFSILHTLCSDTRRYTFNTEPNVVDLGLRLADVERLKLDSEPVFYQGGSDHGRQRVVDPRDNLRACGATEAECAFLVRERARHGWEGQRVEINAMTSRQLVDWLERKLTQHGVKKLVPERAVLEDAYRRAHRLVKVQRATEAADAAARKGRIAIPRDLARRVRAALAKKRTLPWDEAVWQAAGGRGPSGRPPWRQADRPPAKRKPPPGGDVGSKLSPGAGARGARAAPAPPSWEACLATIEQIFRPAQRRQRARRGGSAS